MPETQYPTSVPTEVIKEFEAGLNDYIDEWSRDLEDHLDLDERN